VQYLQGIIDRGFAGTAPHKAIVPEDARSSQHPAKTFNVKKTL